MHPSYALLISNSWGDANTMPTHANEIDKTGGGGLRPPPPCVVNEIGMCGHGIGIPPRIRNEQGITWMQKGATPMN